MLENGPDGDDYENVERMIIRRRILVVVVVVVGVAVEITMMITVMMRRIMMAVKVWRYNDNDDNNHDGDEVKLIKKGQNLKTTKSLQEWILVNRRGCLR